jgi:phosphatidate cytidylyltransferase
VAGVLAAAGAAEVVGLLGRAGRSVDGPLVVVTTVAIVLAAAAGESRAAAAPAGLGWAAAACMATVGLFACAGILRYRPDGATLARITAGAATAVGLGLPIAFLVALRLLSRADGPADGGQRLGLLPLVSLVAVVKAGDIAAYVVGSLVGSHRMAARLSPGKTWEGAAASLAASLAASWIVLDRVDWPTADRPWGGWPAFGVLVGMAGMAGDLAESLVKRDLDAKDSGRSLGGLGGVLDLVDSLLLAAPVAWALWVAG